MTVYVRVKNTLGHEFDLPEEQFDEAKYELVDKKHYPPTTRPRRPKPNVSKGGGPARRPAPSASWTIADLRAYADERGVDLGDATKKDDILAVLIPTHPVDTTKE